MTSIALTSCAQPPEKPATNIVVATPTPMPDFPINIQPQIPALWAHQSPVAASDAPLEPIPAPEPPAGVSAASGAASLTAWPDCPAVIIDVFGPTSPAACSVAWCESQFRPGVTGYSDDRGLFQIIPRWHYDKLARLYLAGMVDNEDYYDPHTNTVLAYVISGGGTDWWAWTCKPF